MKQNMIKILKEEAKKIAIEKFTGCCFVGSLNEIREHVQKEHNARGNWKTERLDGARYIDADAPLYTNADNNTILLNEEGQYWFVCLEDHVHHWESYDDNWWYCSICNQPSIKLKSEKEVG